MNERIAELEKQVEHYKNKAEYLDKREVELLAEITSLEKDLHMVQRHYDQLELPEGYVVVCVHCAKEIGITLDSPSGNNDEDMSKNTETLPSSKL